jgi:hypothetical protein
LGKPKLPQALLPIAAKIVQTLMHLPLRLLKMQSFIFSRLRRENKVGTGL